MRSPKCGRKEIIFIRNFGGFMGLVLGFVQMVATMYWRGNYWFDHLMLPISGFALGWMTNWIALKLIFEPIDPIIIPCGCFEINIQVFCVSLSLSLFLSLFQLVAVLFFLLLCASESFRRCFFGVSGS